MSAIQTPVNQVRLTNIAIVRLKKGGKRFEIACFKNKVMDWRAGIETDITEVLQTTKVFTNVGRGAIAKASDLEAAFEIADQEYCCRMILASGKLQVSDKERKMAQANKYRDIAQYVVAKCINSETRLPFPISMVESAMKELKFNVSPTQSAKQQALELIKQMRETKILPIQRAAMQIRIQIPLKFGKKLRAQVVPLLTDITSEDWMPTCLQVIAQVDPGNFRSVLDLLAAETRGEAKLEILDLQQNIGEAQDITESKFNDDEVDYTKERII